MIHLTIIYSVLLVYLVGGGRTEEDQSEVAILKQVNRVNDDGSYTFGYEAADGSFKIETRDVQGNVKGMFGYVDSSGDLKKVSYSSSNNTGFQTTENTASSASERDALLASFGTSSPASEFPERKPILVLRDSALVAPTKASFIQYIPKKTDSPYAVREYSTPAYETTSADSQNEDLFVNPDTDSEKRFKALRVPIVYPRKIVVTRRPIDDVPRGGNNLRRQLSRRLNEREEDGPHVYGNEIMNSYYDKHMDAHTAIRENSEAERNAASVIGVGHAGVGGVRYEVLEGRVLSRENRAGYVTVPEDIDRTIIYANQNQNPQPAPPPVYPAASVGYRPSPRSPVQEPADYRPNYPITPSPPPYNPYAGMSLLQSLRDELMDFIMQYVHRRLNPYFQDYQVPYQNPYYRNPPLPYPPYPNYPPRNYPPPYPGPLGPGVLPFGVPSFSQLTPNVQYSQSPGGSERDISTNQAVKVLRGRSGGSGYVRRPQYQLSSLERDNRDGQEERRRSQYLYGGTLGTALTTRESSTIQASASTTVATTVAAPNSTPVRNLLILGTTPSPVLGDSRPVTESPDEMEATS